MEAERVRLFVGLPVPDSIVDVVTKVQTWLPDEVGWRKTPVERLHVTLAFIGEVSKAQADVARLAVAGLEDAAGGVPEFDGMLFLPTRRRARVAAIGFSDPDRVIEKLYEVLMNRLEAVEVMGREARGFCPHLTIARARPPIDVGPMSDVPRGVFSVESMCLYQSELKRGGPVYTVVERIALSRG